MIRFRWSRWAIRALTVIMAAGCLPAWAGVLVGGAAYRERMALPADAVFEAVLEDVSRADAPASALGRVRLEPAGQPPFRFEIPYDDAAAQPGRRYAVRATITHQGRLLFTTDRLYPVLDGRNAPLQLRLVAVRAQTRPGPTTSDLGPLPASYEGELPGADGPMAWHLDLLPAGRYQLRIAYPGKPEPNRFDDIGRWTSERDAGRLALRGGREAPIFLTPVDGGAALRKLDMDGKPIASGHNDRLLRQSTFMPIEPRLTLTGMFTYQADAAHITLCADGRRLPVAMEADYKALETAYLQARSQPGQAVLASVEGLITSRPSLEAGRPPQTTLVVERFINVWPRERCGGPMTSNSSLRGVYWKLVRLGDSPTPAAEKQREAHLIFAADAPHLSGSGGCNRLMGGFELDGDQLRLKGMASTMMSCPSGMEVEQRFLQALKTVERWRIQGDRLYLLDGTGAVVAQFKAVALR